ncbi:MAG: J domain-containing protein [Chloroflexota bacterium]|nr:MAG: J domain-containing protein [Chloroflexota bacterium]
MGDDEPNPYTVLQVDPTADQQVIRAAYRALARIYHPDIGHPQSRSRMVDINRAWELLGDANRRTETDRHLRSRAGRAAKDASIGPDAYARRPASSAGPGEAMPATSIWLQRQPNRRVVNNWGGGAAGPPPGRPWGSIVDFGIYRGWSIGEVERVDAGYLAWLAERPEGRPYWSEIAALRARSAAQAIGRARQPVRRRFFGLG